MLSDITPEGSTARYTAHEFVRHTLRRAILRGDLPVGSRLVQAELAEYLQVSTTPVREALRDLATDGLLQLDAHRGAVVRELAFEQVAELYHLRRLLETDAMRRCARTHQPETLERAESLHAALAEETDTGRWAELNRDFHAALIDDAGSLKLRNAVSRLLDTATPYVATTLARHELDVSSAVAEHREILDAVHAGDEERAAEATAAHLGSTMEALERAQGEAPARS